MQTKISCRFCGSTNLLRHERNTRPYAEVLYVCETCGASTKKITAHNPYRAEAPAGYPEPPAAGEWTR